MLSIAKQSIYSNVIKILKGERSGWVFKKQEWINGNQM